MSCLNRTSVGLKRGKAPESPAAAGKPQSNQRGIETRPRRQRVGREDVPQSNQRGIETCPPWGRSRRCAGASIEPAWD